MSRLLLKTKGMNDMSVAGAPSRSRSSLTQLTSLTATPVQTSAPILYLLQHSWPPNMHTHMCTCVRVQAHTQHAHPSLQKHLALKLNFPEADQAEKE